jgi:hypothetical protein
MMIQTSFLRKIQIRNWKNLILSVSSLSKEESIRNAQAAEIFRSSFHNAAKSNTRLSLQDLDDIVASQNVRPSALLPFYQLAGSMFGTAVRFSPIQSCNTTISKIINNATVQQFNDSIREMTGTPSSTNKSDINIDDTKETIKYHRDLEIDNSNATSQSQQDGQQPPYEKTSSSASSDLDSVTLGLTTVMYQFLKLSRNL